MMVLLIEGKVFEQRSACISDLEKAYPVLAARSETLRRRPTATQRSPRLLYVLQREFAVVSPADERVDVLGSEDATTCHLLVLRHTGSGVTALAHLDGAGMEEAVDRMIASMLEVSRGAPEGGRLEAHLVGGFVDDRGESIKLFRDLYRIFRLSTHPLHLVTACVCDANDVVKTDGIHYPIIYGVAVDCKSGTLFPATFPDKGPDMALRSARHFTGSTRRVVADVYDPIGRKLVIKAFDFDPWEEAELWMQQSDDFILKYMSTSPEQEPADFVAHIRQTLQFIIDNPTLRTAGGAFPDGAPRVYEKSHDGAWLMAGKNRVALGEERPEKENGDVKN